MIDDSLVQGLVGFRKVWNNWHSPNWYGYHGVLWQTKPNHPEGYFVNFINLSKTVMKGWSLYLPMGGWLNYPFLNHSEGGRSRNFHIKHVRWGDFGGVEEVTVTDNAGNRLTMHPAELLELLEACCPDGDRDHPWSNGLMVLLHDRERRTSRTAIVNTAEVLTQLIAVVDGTDRLKTTKEGKRIRDGLSLAATKLMYPE